MVINQHHGTYNRTARGIHNIEYLVIHYTAGTGSALNNCQYFAGGDRQASADYFVDDMGVWEYNDPSEGYYTWAVGDGKGKYGIYNYNSIHVEVVNTGGDFSAAEIGHLKELVPYLMNKYGIPAERVVRHYDASRKSCPAGYVDDTKWQALKAEILEEDMALSDEDIAKVAQKVWEWDISGKWANERLYLCNAMDYDTTDPTGRGKELTNHDHIKWMAAEISTLKDEVAEIKALLTAEK